MMNRAKKQLLVSTVLLLAVGQLQAFECAKAIFPLNDLSNAEFRSFARTSDGGMIVATRNALLRLDASGDVVFQKRYSNARPIKTVIQTSDGGFAVVGSQRHFRNSWIARLDSTGNPIWEKHVTNVGVQQIIELFDASGNPDGFALAGSILVQITDVWVARLDSAGNFVWQKNIGDSANQDQAANSIVQTNDGGLAVVGIKGNGAWFLKLDGQGQLLLSQEYRIAARNQFASVVATNDGGVAIAGRVSITGSTTAFDGWLLKLDAEGNVQFSKFYDGGGSDSFGYQISNVVFDIKGQQAIVQAADGGFVIAGFTNSSGRGGSDGWLVRTDSLGDIQWQKAYGGASTDTLSDVAVIASGAIVATGRTSSFFNAGSTDGFLVETDSAGNIPGCNLVTETSADSQVNLSSFFVPGALPQDSTASLISVAPATENVNFFSERLCPAVDTDGDGFLDDTETKLGTDPFSADSYPVKLRVDTFARRLVNTRSHSTLERPPVAATLEVIGTDGSAVALVNERRGLPIASFFARQTAVIAKPAGLSVVEVIATTTIQKGRTTDVVTDSFDFDLTQANPFPLDNFTELDFNVVIVFPPNP